jgi:putative hydrolase of the HAD superfamily
MKNPKSKYGQKLGPDEQLWIIDYDLTLYPHDQKQVLHSLDDNINGFIIEKLGVKLQEAAKIRVKYWESHGTTLAGLQKYEGVYPDEYFDFIQNGPNIIDPQPVKGLREFLLNLKGPKIIFTNGRSDWAHRGIASMGLEGVFDEVYGLEHYGWVGKPEEAPYLFIEELWGNPEPFIFFDDKLDNLETARKRGWSTVWVSPKLEGKSWPSRIDNLIEWNPKS